MVTFKGWVQDGVVRRRMGAALSFMYPVVLFLCVSPMSDYPFKTNELHVCKITFHWQVSICPRAGNTCPVLDRLSLDPWP